MAGEASAEGEGDLRLRAGPGGVAHAVAPGVEVGALDGVLRPVRHHVPAAEVVGEHVVEAVGGDAVDLEGREPAEGVVGIGLGLSGVGIGA